MNRQTIANIVALALVAIAILRATGGGGVLPIPIPVPPSPKPGSWVVLIEETEDRTDEIAKLINDQRWLDSLTAKQLKFRSYDDDQPEARSYAQAIQSLGVPAVVIVSPAGDVLGKFKFPAKREDLDRLIKEATGL